MYDRWSGVRARVSSFLLVVTLAGAVALWVVETLPKHVPQLPAPLVQLASDELNMADQMPSGREAVPVLTYHGISDGKTDEYTVSTQLFARHLAALRRAGYESVSVDTLNEFLAGRPVKLPLRPIVITFDDGEANAWSRADPILAKYGFNAVGFLVTGYVADGDSPSYYLNESQLQALADTGRWSFGGHTHRLHGFAPLAQGGAGSMLDFEVKLPDGSSESLEQWRQRVRADLASSQQFFEDHFGKRASVFAYPFSAYGQDTNDPRIGKELVRLLDEYGYQTAFIGERIDRSLAVLPGKNRYVTPRIGIRSSTSVVDLLGRINDALPAPLQSDGTSLRWAAQSDAGGECAPLRDASPFLLRVTPANSYVTCRLNENTLEWRDYRFSTDIVGASRDTTAVVAVRSAPNFGNDGVPDLTGRLEVAVGESSAEVRQVLGRQVEVLGQLPFPKRIGPAPSRHLEVSVRGTTATVRVDGSAKSGIQVDPAIGSGGVGLSVASTLKKSVSFANPSFDAA